MTNDSATVADKLKKKLHIQSKSGFEKFQVYISVWDIEWLKMCALHILSRNGVPRTSTWQADSLGAFSSALPLLDVQSSPLSLKKRRDCLLPFLIFRLLIWASRRDSLLPFLDAHDPYRSEQLVIVNLKEQFLLSSRSSLPKKIPIETLHHKVFLDYQLIHAEIRWKSNWLVIVVESVAKTSLFNFADPC